VTKQKFLNFYLRTARRKKGKERVNLAERPQGGGAEGRAQGRERGRKFSGKDLLSGWSTWSAKEKKSWLVWVLGGCWGWGVCVGGGGGGGVGGGFVCCFWFFFPQNPPP